MMVDSSYLAKEIITVLDKFESKFVEKIPNNFVELLREASKNCNKDIKLDMSKSLLEQNISEECKDFISAMYYYYFAGAEEKKELISKWMENDPDFKNNIT